MELPPNRYEVIFHRSPRGRRSEAYAPLTPCGQLHPSIYASVKGEDLSLPLRVSIKPSSPCGGRPLTGLLMSSRPCSPLCGDWIESRRQAGAAGRRRSFWDAVRAPRRLYSPF